MSLAKALSGLLLVALVMTAGATRDLTTTPGQVIWQQNYRAGFWSAYTDPLVVTGNKLFFFDGNNTLYCVNALTGTQMWTFPLPATNLAASDIVTGTSTVMSLYTTTFQETQTFVTIVVLNATSGASMWTTNFTGDIAARGSYFPGVYAVTSEYIERKTMLFSETSGDIVQTLHAGEVNTPLLIVSGNMILLSRTILAYAASGSYGLVWNVSLAWYQEAGASVFDFGTNVIIQSVDPASSKMHLTALAAGTGNVVWHITLVQGATTLAWSNTGLLCSLGTQLTYVNVVSGTRTWTTSIKPVQGKQVASISDGAITPTAVSVLSFMTDGSSLLSFHGLNTGRQRGMISPIAAQPQSLVAVPSAKTASVILLGANNVYGYNVTYSSLAFTVPVPGVYAQGSTPFGKGVIVTSTSGVTAIAV